MLHQLKLEYMMFCGLDGIQFHFILIDRQPKLGRQEWQLTTISKDGIGALSAGHMTEIRPNTHGNPSINRLMKFWLETFCSKFGVKFLTFAADNQCQKELNFVDCYILGGVLSLRLQLNLQQKLLQVACRRVLHRQYLESRQQLNAAHLSQKNISLSV